MYKRYRTREFYDSHVCLNSGGILVDELDLLPLSIQFNFDMQANNSLMCPRFMYHAILEGVQKVQTIQ